MGDNLNQKMEEMREEIKIFENIDALRRLAEEEKKGLTQRRKNLKKRRDALRLQLKVQNENFEKSKSVQDNDKLIELLNMEKKIKALEDNLFVMREFIAEKGAETNVQPLKEEVRGLSQEINSLLCDMQQNVG